MGDRARSWNCPRVTTLASPAVHPALVCDRREPAPGVVVLGFRAPELVRAVRPGQFVMVLPPSGERVATALGVYEAHGDRLSLMLVVVGPRTREIAAVRVGERLELAGPLGNGFDCDALGDDVALVAGGVGIAPLFLVARDVRARGGMVHLYYGARTAELLVDEDLFVELGVGTSVATDDGSRGVRGFVTAPLLAREAAPSGIAACGPSPMLRAVGAIARERGVLAQLSLEETFACGVGACWGCVVPHAADASGRARGLVGTQPPSAASIETNDGRVTNVRICKEGPVFLAESLRW